MGRRGARMVVPRWLKETNCEYVPALLSTSRMVVRSRGVLMRVIGKRRGKTPGNYTPVYGERGMRARGLGSATLRCLRSPVVGSPYMLVKSSNHLDYRHGSLQQSSPRACCDGTWQPLRPHIIEHRPHLRPRHILPSPAPRDQASPPSRMPQVLLINFDNINKKNAPEPLKLAGETVNKLYALSTALTMFGSVTPVPEFSV